MRNMARWAAALALLGGARFAAGQMPPPPPPGAGGQNPQKAYLESVRKQSPELYKYLKRLQEIQEETEKIMRSFAKKEIDRDAAKEKLLPLVAEEQKIRQSADFQVEQRLFGAAMMAQAPGRPPGMPPQPPKR